MELVSTCQLRSMSFRNRLIDRIHTYAAIGHCLISSEEKKCFDEGNDRAIFVRSLSDQHTDSIFIIERLS